MLRTVGGLLVSQQWKKEGRRIRRKKNENIHYSGDAEQNTQDRIHVERMKMVVRRFERKLRNESVSGYMVEGKTK